MSQRGVEHVSELVFILWGHDRHIGQTPQIGYIEMAMVSRTILSDKTGSINAKDHRQIWETHVMYDLVKGPLKKS
jgi:hypothetical protein